MTMIATENANDRVRRDAMTIGVPTDLPATNDTDQKETANVANILRHGATETIDGVLLIDRQNGAPALIPNVMDALEDRRQIVVPMVHPVIEMTSDDRKGVTGDLTPKTSKGELLVSNAKSKCFGVRSKVCAAWVPQSPAQHLGPVKVMTFVRVIAISDRHAGDPSGIVPDSDLRWIGTNPTARMGLV